MGLFLTPKWQLTDTDGTILSGGKLHFYDAGTTSDKDTYSDEARTTANANPVVADSNGYVGPIWLKPSKYKVKLATSADVEVWTVDNVKSADMFDLSSVPSTPLDQGALGDGVADESTEVQAALDGGVNSEGVVDLLGGTYKCDTALTIPAGVTLQNGTLDFSACTGPFIVIEGALGSADNLTSNATISDLTLAVTSGTGFTADEMFILDSDNTWGPGAGELGSELKKVLSISGTTLTPVGPILGSYTTANTAKATPVTAKKRVTLKNLRIIDNSSGDNDAVSVKYAMDTVIEGCRFEGVGNSSSDVIKIEASMNTQIKDCVFDDCQTAIFTEGNVAGLHISGCEFRDVDRGIYAGGTSPNGVDRDIVIRGCTATRCATHFAHIEDTCQYVTIADCVVSGNSAGTGIISRAMDAKITGNSIYMFDTSILMSGTAPNPGYGDRYVNTISGNSMHLDAGASVGVDLDGATDAEEIAYHITGNTVHGGGSSVGFQLEAGIGGVTCSGNYMTDLQTIGVQLDVLATTAGPCSISNNAIDGSDHGTTITGIQTDAVNGLSIVGNSMHDVDIGIDIAAGPAASEGIVVSGNAIVDADDHGIRVTGHATNTIDGVVITGNSVRDCTNAALEIVADGDGHVITGNHLERANTTAEVITLNQVSSGMSDVMISGNVIKGGDYGINTNSNVTASGADGNVFIGNSTGTITGTGFTESDSI